MKIVSPTIVTQVLPNSTKYRIYSDIKFVNNFISAKLKFTNLLLWTEIKLRLRLHLQFKLIKFLHGGHDKFTQQAEN